ncbi:MAG: DUF2975 domain-containing protein [Clostridium argentinense]|uniref:DUF2975 domain-containing protein n=1 Tax=Clostridium faecium TaxID=2762223 RepID=A0ABR8YST1_9CLOT|nr:MULTISPECIES: DUF2975 domain-containing protein [Clostridium]MBD8047301.1 DUF2975 domain-containing protein [Clostridium faecium]MBS5825110.1 DUF2975 domain-containing protein [Clostridium argentinense]
MNKRSLTALTIVLSTVLVTGTLVSFSMVFNVIFAFNNSSTLDFFGALGFLVFSLISIVVAYKLKLVVKNIRNGDCFNIKNSNYFKQIGLLLLIFSIIYAIITYPIPYKPGIEFLSTSHGSLKPISFVFLIFGLISYVLSEIFKIAFLTKEENDLTI